MSNYLVFAIVAQWALIMALAALVLGLFRQVGILHERLPSAGALSLSGGARPGEEIPAASYATLQGKNLSIGGAAADGRATLLFFISPTCPMCKSMLPAVLSLASGLSRTTRLVLASDGDVPLQQRMVEREGLQEYPLVLSMELGRQFGVAKLPYAVLIGADGRLVAKGLVNNREHVESLFEAQRLGVSSLQEYLAQQRRA